MKTFIGLVGILIISGCASVPLRTLYHMHDFDPMLADPARLQVAVKTHQAIQLHKGDVRIDLGFTAADNSLQIRDTYLIDVHLGGTVAPQLREDLEEDEQVIVFTLNEQDARQMRESQQRILVYRDKDQEGTGSFGVSVNNLCLAAPVALRDVVVDIYLQTDPDIGYLLLQEDLRLGDHENEQTQWPSCEALAAGTHP